MAPLNKQGKIVFKYIPGTIAIAVVLGSLIFGAVDYIHVRAAALSKPNIIVAQPSIEPTASISATPVISKAPVLIPSKTFLKSVAPSK